MPPKKTLKAQIIELYKTTDGKLDPLQMSQELKKVDIIASPAYCEEVMGAFKDKMGKLGLESMKPKELIFEKVEESGKPIEKPIEKPKEATPPPETVKPGEPKKVQSKVKEPTAGEIKLLEDAAKKKPPEVVNAILTGQSKPVLAAIFKVENWALSKALDEKDILDAETQQSLIETWQPFVDEWLNKLAKDNPALYAAILTTVIMHIPILLRVADKYLSKGKNAKNVTPPKDEYTAKPAITEKKGNESSKGH